MQIHRHLLHFIALIAHVTALIAHCSAVLKSIKRFDGNATRIPCVHLRGCFYRREESRRARDLHAGPCRIDMQGRAYIISMQPRTKLLARSGWNQRNSHMSGTSKPGYVFSTAIVVQPRL